MEKIELFSGATIKETFNDFILSRKTKGLADKTLESYQHQFRSVSKHLDITMNIFALQKKDLNEMIVSMRESGLASNTINCYTRMLKSFFSWCNEEGITDLNIKLYKCEETIKETYTDKELELRIIRERVRSGMANAKAKGAKTGRPQTTAEQIPPIFFRHYPALKSGSLNLSEFARVCGLSRTTVYKYLSLLET